MLGEEEENTLLSNILLQDSVARLTDEQRGILGLVCCGFSMAETAVILGISRTWTGVLYRKIITKLREDFENASVLR